MIKLKKSLFSGWVKDELDSDTFTEVFCGQDIDESEENKSGGALGTSENSV